MMVVAFGLQSGGLPAGVCGFKNCCPSGFYVDCVNRYKLPVGYVSRWRGTKPCSAVLAPFPSVSTHASQL